MEVPPHDSTELTLVEHLTELRKRLGLSLLFFLAASMACFSQVEPIVQFLRRPIAGEVYKFAYFSPTEAFVAYVKIAAVSGLIVSMPLILWQMWAFIKPGLSKKERGYGLVFVGWGSVLFLIGVAFAYAVLLPVSLRFLLGIGESVFEPLISIDRYLSFVITLALGCGLMFELPVVLGTLAKIGLVTPEWLRHQRPMAILGLVVVAALITPTTDIVNLTLMTLPLLALYELSIGVCALALRGKSKPPPGEKD